MGKLVGGVAMSFAALIVASIALLKPAAAENPDGPGAGRFVVLDGKSSAPMPLRHTDVQADIAGIGARVTVRQQFTNPSRTPIEAVYTFPLPHDAAVDRMSIRIGSRLIEGEIKERNEARRVYDAARAQGRVAALLDQERANVFTQSVANIMPGAKIDVEISYVQTLKYEGGEYEFVFPMVVGPRFSPPGTKDPDKITPPITPPGTRSGQTISLSAKIDAGAPIREVKSVLHAIDDRKLDVSHRLVQLRQRDEIPNRDFILRYRVANEQMTSAVLTQYGAGTGHVGFVLLPPRVPTASQVRPKEVVFVMDQSGSQSGFPIQKSKELTLKLIGTLGADDTFNVMGFNTTVRSLWPEPRPATPENLAEARSFVGGIDANGGTMIREGVVAALANQSDSSRLRVVLFNTDGFVGDDPLVLKAIRENRDRARMFVFGIGNSVNRYLVESMSEEGRGASEIVTLNADADAAVARLVRRLEKPVLTDVSVSVDGVAVHDLEPAHLPDVFEDSPVVLFGRYDRPGTGRVTIRGRLGGEPWSQTLPLQLSGNPGSSALPALWARRKISSLERREFQSQYMAADPVEDGEILRLALAYGIMSEYTSFVAVEPKVVNFGGKSRKIRVPVEMADGVSYEGIFGDQLKSSGGMGGAFAAQTAARALNSVVARRELRDKSGFDGASFDPASKISKKLEKVKGKVDVQILLSTMTEKELRALKELGFVLVEKDAKLKAVFGTVDAEKLKKIAELTYVTRIEAIE
jgi:Ca-activated chloride channel family protein